MDLSFLKDGLLTLKTTLMAAITTYGLRLLLTIVLYFVGNKFISLFMNGIEKGFARSKMDLSLSRFLISIFKITLKIVLIISLLGLLDIPTNPVVALLGAAGIGIGMAFQGSLSNFVGGVIILILRPFSVGDYIEEEGKGHAGTVIDIHVFYTTLRTSDNKRITIPNGRLSNGGILNYSKEPERRLELSLSVEYSEDIQKVKETIFGVIGANPRGLKTPEPFIGMRMHAERGIVYDVFVWCKNGDYLSLKYELSEQIKVAFDTHQIQMPSPRMDVYMK